MNGYPLELHPVNAEADEHDADNAGLDTADADDVCEHCESQVGRGRGLFVPYVIVLNQNDELWFVCGPCASPILDPGDAE